MSEAIAWFPNVRRGLPRIVPLAVEPMIAAAWKLAIEIRAIAEDLEGAEAQPMVVRILAIKLVEALTDIDLQLAGVGVDRRGAFAAARSRRRMGRDRALRWRHDRALLRAPVRSARRRGAPVDMRRGDRGVSGPCPGPLGPGRPGSDSTGSAKLVEAVPRGERAGGFSRASRQRRLMTAFLERYSAVFGGGQALLLRMAGLSEAEYRADGASVYDRTGRAWLDFGSFGLHLLGHRHPRIVEAALAQIGRMGLSTKILGSAEATECAEALCTSFTPRMDGVIFGNSGAEAVEGRSKGRAHRDGPAYHHGAARLLSRQDRRSTADQRHAGPPLSRTFSRCGLRRRRRHRRGTRAARPGRHRRDRHRACSGRRRGHARSGTLHRGDRRKLQAPRDVARARRDSDGARSLSARYGRPMRSAANRTSSSPQRRSGAA